MIDQADILKIIGSYVVASGLFPEITWPNKDTTFDKPYLVLDLRPTAFIDNTLRKVNPIWTGALYATSVISLNDYDNAAQAMIKNIAELFPVLTKFTLTSGAKIYVSHHPTPQPGYRDGSYYRMPMMIPLRSDTI